MLNIQFLCSTVGLAQQWDQLDQLGMRMQHNLEQQIQARNQSGVSEDALKEFSMMFKHFDKEKSGRLNHHEFKSCLRALGYDLPMVEEGQPDPEFEAILGMPHSILFYVLVISLNFFRRCCRSKSGWLRVAPRVHGLHDQ
jgi:EF hand